MKIPYLITKAPLLCLIIIVSCSPEEEFIKMPKIKKSYPSCQQYIELAADIISLTNNTLSLIVAIQKQALLEVNNYIDGKKDCVIIQVTKKERTKLYENKKSLQHTLYSFNEQLSLNAT